MTTQESFEELAKREGMSIENIRQIISNLLCEYYLKIEPGAESEVRFNSEGEVELYRVYHVLPEIVSDSRKQIKIDNPLINSGLLENDKLLVKIDKQSLPFYNDGGIALREDLKRKITFQKIFDAYKDSVGSTVWGKIENQKSNGNYCVEIISENVKAIAFVTANDLGEIDIREKLDSDPKNLVKYFLIKSIEKDNRGAPQIFLTRNSDEFIEKVFSENVPEINSGIVEILSLLRVSGTYAYEKRKRSRERRKLENIHERKKISKIKVIVSRTSKNEKNQNQNSHFKIDPAGSCIGQNGVRIKEISEIIGQKIDIVAWSDKIEQLIANLISPVQVISVKKITKGKKDEETQQNNETYDLELTVPDDRVSIVLEYGVLMLRKIEEYLGKKIRVIGSKNKEDEDSLTVWNSNDFNKQQRNEGKRKPRIF